MYASTNGMAGTVATLNQVSNTPGGWITIFVVGFVIAYVLTPPKKGRA